MSFNLLNSRHRYIVYCIVVIAAVIVGLPDFLRRREVKTIIQFYTEADHASPLYDTIRKHEMEEFETRVWLGTEINISNTGGMTPLMLAAQVGNIRHVNGLLEHGAQVNMTDDSGRTALMYDGSDNISMARALVEHGADVNHVDNDGRSVGFYQLVFRMKYRDEFESMANEGYAIATPHEMCGWDDSIAYLMQCGADYNVPDNTGMTPLMWACQHGYSDIVDTLLHYRVNINAIDKEGRTALSMAVENKHYAIANVLVSHGANSDKVSRNGSRG